MQSNHYEAVKAFCQLAGQSAPDCPTTDVDENTRILRAKLILEEAFETIEKGLGIDVMYPRASGDRSTLYSDYFCYNIARPVNLVELADGIADTCVVSNGAAVAYGIQMEEIQKAVDDSNLAKFGPGGIRRDDGKWIKPPDWKAPDIQSIIHKQEKK